MSKKRSTAGGPTDLVLRYALAAVVGAAIVYGSLYPFAFRPMGAFGADILHLAGTWKHSPQSRGDILANLLLYMPLGFTVMSAAVRHKSILAALVVATLAGGVLSLAIELAQFYDIGRVSTLSDVYLNMASTVAGAAIACLVSGDSRSLSWPHGSAPAFARILLLCWLGWRLYPYVPTIDLHQYWRAVHVLLVQDVTVYNIVRYTVLWLSVAFLFRIGLAPKSLLRSVFLAALCFFAAKILVIGQVLYLPEVLGALLAVLLGPIVLQRYARAGVPCLAAFVGMLVIVFRLLPWRFTMMPKAFQWEPFFSFLHTGSFQIQVVSLAEKFYLYGVLLLLLVTAGMKLRTAVLLECALLLSTSVLQMFLVDRSAEITDALLALVLGLIYALLRQFSADGGAAARAGR